MCNNVFYMHWFVHVFTRDVGVYVLLVSMCAHVIHPSTFSFFTVTKSVRIPVCMGVARVLAGNG